MGRAGLSHVFPGRCAGQSARAFTPTQGRVQSAGAQDGVASQGIGHAIASTARRRWLAVAAVGAFAILSGLIWQLSRHGFGAGVYRTGIGEQKTVELEDRSVITLDASDQRT